VPTALKTTDFVGDIMLSQPHFAVSGAADADRNPREFHNPDRA
jgi:hypothetical protein